MASADGPFSSLIPGRRLGFWRNLLVLGLILTGILDTHAQTVPSRAPETRTPSGVTLYSIEGRVVAQDERSPAHQARVTLIDFEGRSVGTIVTDDEGEFAFYDLPTGTYTLNVSHSQYQEVNEPVQLTVTSMQGLRIVLSNSPTMANRPPGQTLPVWAQSIPSEAQKEYVAGVKELQQGKKRNSIPHFETAIRLYPRYASAFGALGSAHLSLGEGKEAATAFESALKIDENLADANMGLGVLYNAEKRYDDAEKHFVRARLARPDDWRIHYGLGEVYWRAGKWESAESSLRRARELYKNLPRIHLLLMNVLSLQDKYSESLATMEDFLRLFPQDPFAPKVRGKRDLLKANLEKESQAKPEQKP